MQALVARPVGIPRAAVIAALLALAGLFVLGFDQGQTLALAQGDTAYHMNLIHELVHDARHAAGFPCH
ncbi:MAG TPA: CbtB-domain containing protein [Chloroflexota bacterium]|nr:CbtB-domain containing protein [Chloroflexota bacterium]